MRGAAAAPLSAATAAAAVKMDAGAAPVVAEAGRAPTPLLLLRRRNAAEATEKSSLRIGES